MSFRNTIDPTVGKVRKNAGKVYESTPSQQIIEVVKPQLMRVGGKQRGIGIGGAIADTKTALQSRILLGYSGNSLSNDLGAFTSITTNATVSSTQKKLGSNSLSFNNQNSGLSFRINEVLRQLKQFSICHWVYFDTSFNYGGPWASWDSNSIASGQLILLNASGGSPSIPVFHAAYNGGSIQSIAAASGSWQLNTWYYMICEWDRVNNKIRMFINNGLIGEPSIPSGAVLNTGVDTFGLGGYNNADSTITNAKCYLDEFVILTGNTTQSERDWLWNSGNGNSLV